MIHKVCEICGGPFSVRNYRKDTARTCSPRCRNTLISRESAVKRGNTLRYRGVGKSYVKLKGRHMHRVVAERKLGRPLKKGETVHHDDRNKRNNDDSNLVVTTQSKHIRLHIREMLAARKVKAGY